MLPRQLGQCAGGTTPADHIRVICSANIQQFNPLLHTMDAKTLASEIVGAGADKVLEKNPKRVDDAVANTVIKRGANALESGVSKGNVDPALGAAAEVVNRR